MLCIFIRRNCQTHGHPLGAVNKVLYNVRHVLVDFDINRCVVGRVSPGVVQWDMMGVDGRRLSTIAVFFFPHIARVARIRTHTPIVVVRRSTTCACS
jgi:hypothetical protein